MLEKVKVEALPEMPVTIVLEEAKFCEGMCQLGWKKVRKQRDAYGFLFESIACCDGVFGIVGLALDFFVLASFAASFVSILPCIVSCGQLTHPSRRYHTTPI